MKKLLLMCLMVMCMVTVMGTGQVQAKDKDGDYVIVIDPGHGSADPGAVSKHGDKENDLNWRIALAFKAELETYDGVKVYLTKGSAEPFSNTGRGRLGAQLGADFAISVHNNSNSSSTSNGAITYTTVDQKLVGAGTKLASMISAEIATLGIRNGGVGKRGSEFTHNGAPVNYYTFLDEAAKCNIPALIIEHCYLSNPTDSTFVHQVNNQYRLGVADATAVAKYFGLSKRVQGDRTSVELIRTYSIAMTVSGSGKFTSSNEAVAKVSNKGVVTAVGAGSAVITFTGDDGSSKTLNVTVPPVKIIAIAAGVTPTMYKTKEQLVAFNRSTVVVKAIYSDGSITQVKGASIGDPVFGSTVTYTYGDGSTGAVTSADAPVSYGGFTTKLRMYYGPRLTLGSYSTANYVPTGANTDILMLPWQFAEVTTPSPNNPPVLPTQPPTQAPTQAPTESQTQTESQSESQGESQSVQQTESQSQSESQTDKPVDKPLNGDEDKDSSTTVLIAVLVVALVVLGIIAAVFALRVKKKRAYKKRRKNNRR